MITKTSHATPPPAIDAEATPRPHPDSRSGGSGTGEGTPAQGTDEPTAAPGEDATITTHEPADSTVAGEEVADQGPPGTRRRWPLSPRALPSMSSTAAAALVGITALIAVAAVLAWLVVGLHRQHVADQQYDLYLQTGRQGALNLTTIDYQHVDADVARILDSATGTFHDDFAARAKDFADVVKQTQSHTEGTIVDAGVETENSTGAQIIVAVNVKTTQAGQSQQRARGWRMRVLVEDIGDTAKIANVEFVP